MRYMGTLVKQIIFTTILGWIANLLTALVITPFVWVGWNEGAVLAVGWGPQPIGWRAAYFLSLFATVMSGLTRSSFTFNSRD